MIGSNSGDPGAVMTISFAPPVAGIGGFLNYGTGAGAGGPATIAVYNSTHSLIESKVLGFTTSGGLNQGQYLAFLECTSNIRYFTLSGAYIGGTNFELLAAVPEPETYVMLLAGLGLIGFAVRRRA